MKKFSNVIDHQQFDLSINPKVYSSSLQLDLSINSSLTQLYLQLTLKADSRKWKVGAQWYLSTTRTAYSSPSLYASCLFSVRVISRRLRLITPTSTLIFLDIEKKHHPIIFRTKAKSMHLGSPSTQLKITLKPNHLAKSSRQKKKKLACSIDQLWKPQQPTFSFHPAFTSGLVTIGLSCSCPSTFRCEIWAPSAWKKVSL